MNKDYKLKTFKASDFARSPEKVYEEALINGAIIQQCRTNGEIKEEFVLIPKESLDELINGSIELSNLVAELGDQAGVANT